MANPVERIRHFVHQVTSELKKCSWPQRKQLTESTVLVIVSVLMLSVFVAVVDQVSQLVIRYITQAGG